MCDHEDYPCCGCGDAFPDSSYDDGQGYDDYDYDDEDYGE